MTTTIANTHSNPTSGSGQSATGRRPGLIALVVLLLCLFGFGGVGCRSVYREAQDLYPADPCARLELRIQEARAAEKQAEKAAATLRDHVAKGVAGQTVESDIDRLELTTLDFRRRVASARDAAVDCEQPNPFGDELDRLERRAAQMQKNVQTVRQTGAAGPVMTVEPDTQ